MSDEQQLLAPDWDEDALVQDEKRRGIFSGELLKKYDPEKYRVICHHLAAGLHVSTVARMVESSRNTVSAIKKSQPVEIEQERKKIAAGSATIVDLITEEQVDRLTDPEERKKISFKDLGVVKGIEIDKFQIATGGATQRVELAAASAGPGHDDYLEEIGFGGGKFHEKEARIIDVDAVDVGPRALSAGASVDTAAPGSNDRKDGRNEEKVD